MTGTEIQYESNLRTQLNNAINTGNWTQVILVFKQITFVSTSVADEILNDLGDDIAAIISKDVIFIQLLQNSAYVRNEANGPHSIQSSLTLGELVELLSMIKPEAINLGCLSRNRIKDLSKIVDIKPLAIRLQKNLTERNTNVISITAKTCPEAYIFKVLEPVRKLHELYQWATIQNPKYYDTVLDIDKVFTILGDNKSDSTFALNNLIKSTKAENCQRTNSDNVNVN